MIVLEGERFEHLGNRCRTQAGWESGWHLEGHCFRDCWWDEVGTGMFDGVPIGDWPRFTDVAFVGGEVGSMWHAGHTVLDGVDIDGLQREVWMTDCAMRHVRLAGRIPDVRITWGQRLPPTDAGTEVTDAFHADVDWLFDVSDLRCRELYLREAPPHQVIIDPLRQGFLRLDAPDEWRAAFDGVELVGITGSVIGWHMEKPQSGAQSFVDINPRSRNGPAEMELLAHAVAAGLTRPTYEGAR